MPDINGDVDYTRGVELVLKIGNKASPQVFTPFCSINAARGVTFTTALNEQIIPNCTDPDKIAWIAREKVSRSMAFNGAGMLDKADVKRASDIDDDEEPQDFQVILDDEDEDRVIMWEGKFHMSDFAITGDRGAKVEFSVNFASDGVVTPTFGSAVGGT